MQNTTIAVDGSLYRFHPKFKKNMEKTMQILVNPHIRVSFVVIILYQYIYSYRYLPFFIYHQNLYFCIWSFIIVYVYNYYLLVNYIGN